MIHLTEIDVECRVDRVTDFFRRGREREHQLRALLLPVEDGGVPGAGREENQERGSWHLLELDFQVHHHYFVELEVI